MPHLKAPALAAVGEAALKGCAPLGMRAPWAVPAGSADWLSTEERGVWGPAGTKPPHADTVGLWNPTRGGSPQAENEKKLPARLPGSPRCTRSRCALLTPKLCPSPASVCRLEVCLGSDRALEQ